MEKRKKPQEGARRGRLGHQEMKQIASMKEKGNNRASKKQEVRTNPTTLKNKKNVTMEVKEKKWEDWANRRGAPFVGATLMFGTLKLP